MERTPASLDQQISTFYAEQRLALYRHLLLLGLPPAEAQNTAHQAFLALHRALRDGGKVDNWRVWIYSKARTPASDRSHVPAVGKRGHVLSALAELPPQQRECIQLRAAGFGHREIASITGLKHSAITDYLRRAVVHLRQAGL